MAEIIWNKNIEPENKKEIEIYLNPFLWLIPKWCQHITINLYSSDGDAAISTLVDYEYRKITVDFYACWLAQSPQLKQDNVIHECVHFFVNELYHQARRIVKATCADNEQLKDFAFAELEKTVESVTQDLTFAIFNQFAFEHPLGWTKEQQENAAHNLNLLLKKPKKSKGNERKKA